MRATRGFTLIELLVVISILALLLALASTQFSRFLGEGERADAVARITALQGALEQHRGLTGDYPPSRLEKVGAKTRNKLFEGNEALVVALHAKGYDGQRIDEKWLGNLDGDRAEKNVTIFDEPVLLEVLDPWGNPFVYLRYDDYGQPQDYEFTAGDTGEVRAAAVGAAKNDMTGSFYAKESYQLASVGPDGAYGTDDDVTSYR